MSLIEVESIRCINGCEFFPKVLPDGTIKKYDRCRKCRIYLDRKKVKRGINLRKKHLIPGVKKDRVGRIHPVCKLCKITLYDQVTLDKHNGRLHK